MNVYIVLYEEIGRDVEVTVFRESDEAIEFAYGKAVEFHLRPDAEPPKGWLFSAGDEEGDMISVIERKVR